MSSGSLTKIVDDIMEDWLTVFNLRMKQQNQTVLLFLDNTTHHPCTELSNIRLVKFSPNTTSVNSTHESRCYKLTKMNYCKLLTQSLLANMESAISATGLANCISVLDAVI